MRLAYKRKGIVATPGVHHNFRTGLDEVVTWDELKAAVQFQNRIPIIAKPHPQSGYINPDDRIGTVTQKVNEKTKQIEGEFWFFDEPEYWSQIPSEIKKKIVSGKEISLSAGYKVGSIVEGRQTSRQYDHLTLDVTNPMFSDVGITEGDVRMESKLPDNFRIEETPTIEGEKKKEEPKTQPPDANQTYDKEFWIEYGKNLARLEQLEAEQTKPAVEETTEETSPETEPTPEPSPPKAKTAVPQGSSSKKEDLDEDGVFRIDVG